MKFYLQPLLNKCYPSQSRVKNSKQMKKAIWFLAFSLTCISAYSQKLPQKVEYRLENLKSIDGL